MDNMHDRMHMNRMPIGQNHGMAKLRIDQVRQIRKKHNEGQSQTDLGRIYGVTKEAIGLIVHNKTWKHVV